MTSPTDWGKGQVGHGWQHSGLTKRIKGNPSDSDVESAYPWLWKVNPRREWSPDFATNCVITSIATDMSLRGQAVPSQWHQRVARPGSAELSASAAQDRG